MTYYLVETLNRKTGEITQSNPIEVPEEVLKNWMQPYQEYLINRLTDNLSATKEAGN